MNIASRIREHASKTPFKKAVVFPSGVDHQDRGIYSHLTFADLDAISNGLAQELAQMGVERNHKVLLFVKPSLELSLLAFALFKIGATLVLIDPGIGIPSFKKALREMRCEVLIAPAFIHWLSLLFTGFKAKPKITINTSLVFPAFAQSFQKILRRVKGESNFVICPVSESDLAAIVYTSGATGPAKGVAYTHGIFHNQVNLLADLFNFSDSDKDLAGFPLFSLTTIAMGVTSYIPTLNPTKPAKADPKKIVRLIHEQGITTASGSPAIWRNVLEYCQQYGIKLPSIRALFMFGAPVEPELIEGFANILPRGSTYTPYGATECLPVSCIRGSELLGKNIAASRKGHGTCIGKVVDKTQLKVIEASDNPIAHEDDFRELGPYQVGEVIVQGGQVTPSYVGNEQATALAKIKSKNGLLWHRMGDLAYFDKAGDLWFCGRKAHVVHAGGQVYYSVPCEAVFLNHEAVKKAALIRIGSGDNEKPAIVLERKDQKTKLTSKEQKGFLRDLMRIASSFEHTKEIDTFFIHHSFPVDRRHNIKIDRHRLQEIFAKKVELRL